MRAVLLLAAATLPLAACDIQKTDKTDKTVAFDAAENGAVAFQVPGMKGNIKLPTAMMTSSDMDIDGVKLIPGSHVGTVRAQDKVVTIGFTSPGSMSAVKDYYTNQFAEKGVTAIARGNGFAGKTKDGDTFTLDLADAGDKTAGTLVIHDKD